jgi:dipeptidyl aminopeptidase/acylaminoacyl peptidase
MTVDDLLSMQSLREVVPSPNGEWLAVVIKRPGAPPNGTANDIYADVWLVPRHGGPARNLTGSWGKSTHWWNPVWSPDGGRLALLARTDSSNLAPYIWTMRNGSLTRLIDQSVDRYAAFDRSWPNTPIVWLDSVTVLGAFCERGVRQNPYRGSISKTERLAQEGWAKTKAGVEPAVSVLESGRDVPASERPRGQLLRIDVRTGKSRVVAEGYFWRIILDRQKRRAALIVDAGRVPPSENRPLGYIYHFFDSTRHTRLAIVRLDSIAPVFWVDEIRDPRITEDGLERHAWSSDGSMFAVVAKDSASDPYGTTAYLISVESGAVRQLTDRALDVSATTWAGNDAILVLAQKAAFAPPVTDSNRSRYDWWKIAPRGEANDKNGTNITSTLATVPQQLEATQDTNEMLGLADGHLVSINVGGPVSDSSPPGEWEWSWPNRGTNGQPLDELFVQSAKGDYYAIPVHRQGTHTEPRLMKRPSPDATLEAADPEHHLAVFAANERTGSTLWVGDGETTQFESRLTVNQQLRDIADAKRMLISYIGADGDSLKGLIVLPVGYTPGVRYPLVAFVYGGVMIRDTLSPILIDKQWVSSLNLNLIPAHGYALLIPSVPVSPEGGAGDPMIDIPKGVLAAVDEAARVGIADPDRTGIMGQSFGGYSTYSVITYTRRFRAAVVLAGYDDQASLYGDFDAEVRYSDYGFEMQHTQALFENGQSRMGASPWSNLWRYMRNSPYYYADRVQTPVMILQGDMDYVGMEQGEEFFNALYRMGKPAKFVRYWGESHVIEQSPANIRDMWHRIFDWFDEHLAVQQRSASTGRP